MELRQSTDGDRMSQRIRKMEGWLRAMFQITEAINGNVSARALLKLYERVLVQNVQASKLAVFIQNVGWMCSNAFGIERREAEAMLLPKLHTIRQLTHLHNTNEEWAAHFHLVIPVFHKSVPLAYTFIRFADANAFPSDEELNYIQTITSIIAVAIENKKLFRHHVKQRFIKSELEMARQMQTMLIPGRLPDDERVSAAGVYLPHLEVGGDYYDFIEISENEFFICIADISGKGVVAALLMANFQAIMRTLAEHERSLARLVEMLNRRVNEITQGEKFITLFMARFHRSTRELSFINAGHNPAILYHDGTFRLLEEGTTILGMFDSLPFVNVQHLVLPNEFLICCYTDGLLDIQNPQGEMLTVQHLMEIIRTHDGLKPSALNKKIVDTIVAIKGSHALSDDVSLLTCRFYSSP